MKKIRSLSAAVAIAAALTAAPARAQDPLPTPPGFKGFVADVAHDYVNFLSVENLKVTTAGLAAAGFTHLGDEDIVEDTAGPTPLALKPGATYGNLAFQIPLGVTWWVVGHAAGSSRAAEAGRDLVRAQISAASWTYAIKYMANRT